MPTNGVSHAAKAKKERQESLRELLSSQGHLQHILELTQKIEKLEEELEPIEFQRLSKVIDTKLALLKKYLPDLKSIEGDINMSSTVIIKNLKGVDRG